MKTQGNFRYFLDDVEIATFEKFEQKIKNITVTIEIDKLNVKARTKI